MNESPRCGALSFLVVFDILFLPVREKRSRKTYRFLLVSDGLDRSFENYLFRCSSTVEQLPVKELVVGSSPTTGAKKLDTNSNFEDERVRSQANFFLPRRVAERFLRGLPLHFCPLVQEPLLFFQKPFFW